MAWFKRDKPKELPVPPPERKSLFSTDLPLHGMSKLMPDVFHQLIKAQPALHGMAMDDSSNGYPAFKEYNNAYNSVSDTLVNWYATMGFISYQIAGIVAQHWLIDKACTMPGDDAVRNGYDLVSSDGEDLDPEATKILKRLDRSFGIKDKMREFSRKGRIFGIRIAMFKVTSTDPEYYEKPFNIDGVTPKSYKGIVQIDPYWTAPILDAAAASQPDSLHFYEPTWWLINGKKVHRTHLVIYRRSEPVDVLKPQYLYGGIPLPQQIMERVYAAERTANEAPLLALSKRTTVWLTDMEKAMADPGKASKLLEWWASMRDNFGLKLGDKDGDEYQQFETSLTGLDETVMTQYQLVCSVAGVPATKMLGTSPKGFGASGEYEESSYHETVEGIQQDILTPFLERHHQLAMKSHVEPVISDMAGMEICVNWLPLDTPTAKELAETNLIKAQTDDALIACGAIDPQESRNRIALDKTSGYNELGLSESEAPGIPEMQQDPDSEKLLSNAEKPHGVA